MRKFTCIAIALSLSASALLAKVSVATFYPSDTASAWSPLSLSPVGWWRGDNSAADSSGSGIHLGWYGSAAYTNGINGSAFSFTGATCVSNGFHTSLATTNMSLCYWANCTGGAGSLRVLASMRQTSPSRGYYTGASSGNAWVTSMAISDGASLAVGTAAVTNSTWVHVATTYDGAVARVYVNAQLNSVSTNAYLPATTSGFMIGALVDAGPRLFFTGAVDDFLVFNRALNATEIGLLYNWRQ